MTARIVYLDQCAISSIVKNKDDLWRRLYDKLRHLLAQEVILCPTSQLHYDESILSEDWREELWAKCQELAGSWRFLPLETIENLQLRYALRNHLGEPEEPQSPWIAVDRCEGRLGVHERHAASVRQCRESSFERIHRLVEYFESFESARIAVIQRYTEEILAGERATSAVHLIEQLEGEVRRLRPTENEPMVVIQEFLRCQAVQPVPFLDIWGRLWATISQHVQSTVKPRKIKPSDIYDVQGISFYGPYCDAMFIDNEFRKLASQRNVDVPGRYGVRLFSETNREKFKVWLDEISAGVDSRECRPGHGEIPVVWRYDACRDFRPRLKE